MPDPPCCIVIAGPNGTGKTTFARPFLSRDSGITHFVNVDLIAGGLSPFRPELAALVAGRIFVSELDRLARSHLSFSFETTLSGLGHLTRLRQLKASGYTTRIVFIKLDSPALALRRVATRVRQSGHAVPAADVLRRFDRGWKNFTQCYRLAVDEWAVYDNSGDAPILIDTKP
jgi:predicted ABC-type ATPase